MEDVSKRLTEADLALTLLNRQPAGRRPPSHFVEATASSPNAAPSWLLPARIRPGERTWVVLGDMFIGAPMPVARATVQDGTEQCPCPAAFRTT